MKLTLKLPLAFAAALLLALAAALLGIHTLYQSNAAYATTVQAQHRHAALAADMLGDFKTQVQEWKNVLLRGKDSKALEKHWKAFGHVESEIAKHGKTLTAELPAGEARAMIEKFALAHATMGQNYRKAFAAFEAAGFDASVGDNAVRGMDREPAKLLDEAGEKLLAESVATAAMLTERAQQATLFSVVLMLVVCLAGIGGGVWLSRAIARPLARAAGVARAVAGGDLTAAMQVPGTDEVSQLLSAMHDMQVALVGVVEQVRRNAECVSTASAQIAQGNQDLSQRTEEQASSLQQTAATMEELGSTARNNTDSARRANQLAQSASAVAVQGGAVVSQVVETMKGISDSSRKIAEIIATIDGIAFQTNILALNAAVEAARAGEQGRGFAVVASEVRTLAQRSAGAAREIKSLITASVERVEQGTTLVNQAGQTMGEVVASIQRVSDMVGEISNASVEQSSGVQQVGDAVGQMDRVTQQNAALVEEAAAAAESMKVQAAALVQAVAVFKLAPATAD